MPNLGVQRLGRGEPGHPDERVRRPSGVSSAGFLTGSSIRPAQWVLLNSKDRAAAHDYGKSSTPANRNPTRIA
jgi:hypothetical protein